MANQVALVTGGSRGIGRGIVLALARAGFDVAVNYRGNVDAARETAASAASLGVRTEILQGDIGVRDDRMRLLAEVRNRFGRLDLLVNNAGVAPAQRADLLETTEANFDQLLSTNLKGPYFLTQQAARWMIEQRKTDPTCHPKIITISSVSAFTSSTNRGEYCVSKAGLGMMTRLFADRLAEFGIGVYEIRPGIIATDMTAGVREKYEDFFRRGGLPIARWGTPEDVGKAVTAIAMDLLPYSTGEVINVDGGFHLHRL